MPGTYCGGLNCERPLDGPTSPVYRRDPFVYLAVLHFIVTGERFPARIGFGMRSGAFSPGGDVTSHRRACRRGACPAPPRPPPLPCCASDRFFRKQSAEGARISSSPPTVITFARQRLTRVTPGGLRSMRAYTPCERPPGNPASVFRRFPFGRRCHIAIKIARADASRARRRQGDPKRRLLRRLRPRVARSPPSMRAFRPQHGGGSSPATTQLFGGGPRWGVSISAVSCPVIQQKPASSNGALGKRGRANREQVRFLPLTGLRAPTRVDRGGR